MTGRALNATLFALAFTTSAAAQTPTPSGGHDVFTITDCAAPIPLRFVAPDQPAAIRTGDIAPRPPSTPPAWTIEWDAPAAIDSAIQEYASAGHIKNGCPAPGLYGVPLTLYTDAHASSPLAITLIRVAEPVLDAPVSVSLSADRLWGVPDPVPLLLRQTVAGAPETRVFVQGGDLKTAAGEATGIALEPLPGPVIVKPGETARVMLAPSEPPAAGIYTTRLVLNGPAVKPGTTIEVTYKVRLATWCLLIAIALGIALGILLNAQLAARAAFEAALLAGRRAAQALGRRAAPQRDPAVQQRLLAVANLLHSDLDTATTAAEAAKQVQAAEAQAKEIENRAVETAAALLQSLAAIRALFRPGDQDLDPLLAARLATPLADLDALQRAADAGDVEQTTARLQDFARDLPARIAPLVQGFLADLRTDLQALGPLPPGDALAATRDALSRTADEILTSPDPAALIDIADGLARRLRAWIDLVAPEALAVTWRRAAQILAIESPPVPPALPRRLDFAADQAEQLRRTARDPLERLRTLADIARSVSTALTDADTLSYGDIVALAGPPAARLQPPSPSARQAVTLPAGSAAVLRIKPLIPLGQDSIVALRWLGPPPQPGRVNWSCTPEGAATLLPVPAGAVLRPSQPGFLTIALDLDQHRVAEARTYAGELSDPPAPAAPRQARLRPAALTLAAALFTAFAGYQTLAPAWLGTIGDLLAATLWGLIGQLALDRLRQRSTP